MLYFKHTRSCARTSWLDNSCGRKRDEKEKNIRKWSRKRDPIHPWVLTLALDLRLPPPIRPLCSKLYHTRVLLRSRHGGKDENFVFAYLYLKHGDSVIEHLNADGQNLARPLSEAGRGAAPTGRLVCCRIHGWLSTRAASGVPRDDLTVQTKERNQELFIVHIDIGRETIIFSIDFFREETLEGIKVNLDHRKENWKGNKIERVN